MALTYLEQGSVQADAGFQARVRAAIERELAYWRAVGVGGAITQGRYDFALKILRSAADAQRVYERAIVATAASTAVVGETNAAAALALSDGAVQSAVTAVIDAMIAAGG